MLYGLLDRENNCKFCGRRVKGYFASSEVCAGTIILMEPSRSMRDRKPFTDLTNTTIQGTQIPHHVDPKEHDREGKRFLVATMSDEKRIEYNRTIRERRMRRKTEQGAIQHIPNHHQDDTVHMEADENDVWLHRGDLGENKYRLHVGTTESDGDVGLINDEAPCGEMEDLCDQSCISPLCEGDINAALRNDDDTFGDMGDVWDESCSSPVGEAGNPVLANY
ncbi:hypothetical protein SETIT_4G171800v2 [Setaria italica]|uniref:Uncharacterized protein n=1 Tax=Setaria italica TaxID=4555 RepID=A0A368QV67_SETIT|nr:hypothetical protein SETIT_4G171800v2 [Setaria italica]